MFTNQRSQQHPGVHRRRRVLIAGAIALALVASACGSDSKSSSSEPVGTDVATAGSTAMTSGTDAMTSGTDAMTSGTDAMTSGTEATVAGVVFDQKLHDLLPKDIQDSGTLTLATDPTDPPLEFFDENNKVVGAEVDFAKALGTILGVKVVLEQSKFDAIIPGVEAGRFDGSLSGFADRKERQKVVDFVDFFTSSRGYLIKKGGQQVADATDLCGLSVAVAKGTTMADSIADLSTACKDAGNKAIDGQILPDQAATVLAVQSGRADVTILSDHAALAIAQQSNGELEVVLSATEGKDINGILLRKGDLVAAVQPAVQQMMDSGALLAIMTKWNLQTLALDKATVNAGVN